MTKNDGLLLIKNTIYLRIKDKVMAERFYNFILYLNKNSAISYGSMYNIFRYNSKYDESFDCFVINKETIVDRIIMNLADFVKFNVFSGKKIKNFPTSVEYFECYRKLFMSYFNDSYKMNEFVEDINIFKQLDEINMYHIE